MDNIRECIKKYVISNKNVLSSVWTDENDMKKIVWMKIFCFIFIKTKMDPFANVLVWSGHKIPSGL